MLIFTSVTLILQLIQTVLVFLKEKSEDEFLDHDKLQKLNYVTIGLVSVFFCLVLYLLIFHLYLVKKKLTTIKYLRQK